MIPFKIKKLTLFAFLNVTAIDILAVEGVN